MALTPSRVRQDLKCGKGSISPGETCRKGPATAVKPTQPKPRRPRKGEGTPLEKALVIGGAVGAVGSFGYGLHQLSKGNWERASAASTAAGGFASISGVGVNLAGRRTKSKELAALGNKIIVAGGLQAAMNGMDWRRERDNRKAREQRAENFKEWSNRAQEASKQRAEEQRDYWRQRAREYARGNNGQGYRRPPGANGAVPDYLGILGINSSAGAATAKRAWRNLAAQNHPDRGGDPEKAKLINAAYQEFKRRRGDSIWADGFTLDTDSLAI